MLRPEFQPTLPALLHGRGRAATAGVIAAALLLVGVFAVARATGAGQEPTLVVNREPAFTMLVPKGELRRVEPRGAEHLRLEGRGRHVAMTVTVSALPDAAAGLAPPPAELPIEADLVLDDLRRRHDGLVVLEEGRARVNDASGYQVRYRSGPLAAPRFGHDVVLVPAPPARGPAILVSLVQRNERPKLGPDDRRLAYEAKRAFRSVRFGTERP